MLRNRPIHLKLYRATEGKEMVNVVTQDNVRELLVPSDTINVYPSIWPTNELKRIKSAGRIVTKTERQRMCDELEAEKQRLEKESENRKMFLKGIDQKRERTRSDGVAEKGANDDDDDDVTDEKILSQSYLAKQEQASNINFR